MLYHTEKRAFGLAFHCPLRQKADIDALWTLVIDRPVSDVAVADRLANVCAVWGRWAGISMHGRTDPTPE